MPGQGSEASSEGRGRVPGGLGRLAGMCLGDGKGRSLVQAQTLRLFSSRGPRGQVYNFKPVQF